MLFRVDGHLADCGGTFLASEIAVGRCLPFRVQPATAGGEELERLLNQQSDDAGDTFDLAAGQDSWNVQDSDNYARSIIESSLDMIIAVDNERRIRVFNPAAQDTFGYGADEVIGQHIGFLYAHPEQGEAVHFTTVSQGRCVQEIANRRKNGEVFPSVLAAAVLRDNSGRPVGVMGTSRDITEQRRLEAQLVLAQRMESVGRLAGGVAHDFNNLLTVIMGSAGLAAKDLPGDHPVQKELQEIRDASERAADLTRQLLAFASRQPASVKVLDLNGVVANVAKMLRRLIGEDIELVLIPASGAMPVRVDPGQIEQVLMNLVVNARDAMPCGGKLILETSRTNLLEGQAYDPNAEAGDHVLLKVSDTGCGMSEDVRAHCFDPFFTTKERGKGTGLGLATCYGIVRQSGGHIWVESAEGRGTSVHIRLPVCDESDIEAVIMGEIVHELPGGTETILLVEDEAAVRGLAGRMLRGKGYRVLEAGSGEEALHIARALPSEIHLVIADVVLPGEGGFQVAEDLAVLRPDVKVLLISGYADESLSRRGAIDPDLEILQKPFSLEGLLRKAREVLDANGG